MNKYPIYIPSKGRADECWTARALEKDGVPFHVVVESQERDLYAEHVNPDRLLVLPFQDQGSVIPARNWIKAHATATGAARHWQLDDNLVYFKRRYRGRRIPCEAGTALAFVEDFTDRYTNVAISGMNYEMFLPTGQACPPFHLNCRVYSCSLILNAIPYRWRGRYNEDTDLCLQVLSDGWCTLLINAFFVWKQWTMQMKGGNTDALYHGDGRLKMARSLERQWPGVVTTKRRFQRPQHVVKDAWKRFDTPLEYRDDFNPDDLDPSKYRMTLKQIKPIQSPALRQLYEDYNDAPAK